MLYVVPSTGSVSLSLVHATVVAGEPVEVQVRVLVPQSYVRLDTVGGAEGRKAICQYTFQQIANTISMQNLYHQPSKLIRALKKLQQQQCSE